MPTEFARLTSQQLQALHPDRTVFFFGVGPIEDHGSHLPIGMDLLEAYQLCYSAAHRVERDLPGWTGVLMPPAPLGVDANTQKIAITVRSHVLRDWLVDACRALKRSGFRHFVCFSGNLGPKQLTAIEDAAKLVNRGGIFRPRARRAELVSASSALVTAKDLKDSLFWPDPLEHGGARDTSIGLWMKQISEPGLIPGLIRQDRPAAFASRAVRRLSKQVSGYWGDPAQAYPEAGQEAVQQVLDKVFPKLRAVWDGANPNALFRSWYSVLFFNKSFFKSWILALLVILLLLAWYAISFR
jgi:creatinine amidohydrolase/Fe(II)-dependent formamide hydrolase-like protein